MIYTNIVILGHRITRCVSEDFKKSYKNYYKNFRYVNTTNYINIINILHAWCLSTCNYVAQLLCEYTITISNMMIDTIILMIRHRVTRFFPEDENKKYCTNWYKKFGYVTKTKCMVIIDIVYALPLSTCYCVT